MYRIPVYRVALVRERVQTTDRKVISSPADAYEILKEFIGEADREQFVILLLDTRHNLRGIHVVSIGSLNASIVHPREVFKPVLLANCAGIVMGHNHPSGDPDASSEDLALTSRIKQGGELLGISVLDHIILGQDTFVSLKDRGLM
ncbi:MAG: JAB domain-containing protein [Armatimonadota bacterium]